MLGATPPLLHMPSKSISQDIRLRVWNSNRGRNTAESNCSLDLEGLRKHSRQVGGRINVRCVIDCSHCYSFASVTDVETRWRIDLTADPLADCISSQGAPQLQHLPDPTAEYRNLRT
jgi:hypothetical protein